MSRLERKNRSDIEFMGYGGLTDAFDDLIKDQWRINDDEYNWICEFASNEELDHFLPRIKPLTFSEKRDSIKCVNELLIKYTNSLND